MFPSFHSLGTKPWHIDELNIVVIGFDIVAPTTPKSYG
jgi:hypothetical protein